MLLLLLAVADIPAASTPTLPQVVELDDDAMMAYLDVSGLLTRPLLPYLPVPASSLLERVQQCVGACWHDACMQLRARHVGVCTITPN